MIKKSRKRVKGLQLLPDKPGIYKFFNESGILLYVGKAKNLKKRVDSYFSKKTHENRKTYRLVFETHRVEYTISESEFDAFLLENNLIKENQPRYNILLKDDKSFPFICITKERFPRIISTRRVNHKTEDYYGPYTSVVAMKNVLELIRKLYTIRTCKYNLSEKNINAGKFKLCLEYHIGNCLGPCEGLQTEDDYNNDISQAREILKGNMAIVRDHFKTEMKKYANSLAYEKAHLFKEKFELLDKFQSKTVIVNPKHTNIHVSTILSDNKVAYLNYLRIQNGAINYTKTIRVKKKLDETDEAIINHLLYIVGFVKEDFSKAELISNVEITNLSEKIDVHIPLRGDKRKLVEMSLKNALQLKQEYIGAKENLKGNAKETLSMLQLDLNLKDLPKHIEGFDNSNLHGTNPVASMVCFKNGVPSKKDYRHFNIKTVKGADDFSSMNEIVNRRYKRLMEEDLPLPDLIIVDGGKGQLNAAVEALKKLKIYGKIPIVGIAKKLEEIYYPEDPLPLHIQKKSPSLKLIQRVRDEAHRFAINFHRNKRSKSAFKTELEEIPGIGKATADKLLKKYKSLRKIRLLEESELSQMVGVKLARSIKNHWK
jgi:excinuclease ABC subunit C